LIGLEFVRDRQTASGRRDLRDGIQGCADEGLLVLSCGVEHNVIRWIPPLDATSEEIDEALGIFRRVLRSLPVDGGATGI